MKYESNENKKASEAKKSYRPVWRGCVAAAAAVLVAGTIGLNASPVFAENMSKVPVVGQLAQVLTFRSFEGTEGDVELNVNVPVVKGPDGKELPAKVNARIRQLTADMKRRQKRKWQNIRNPSSKQAAQRKNGQIAPWICISITM